VIFQNAGLCDKFRLAARVMDTIRRIVEWTLSRPLVYSLSPQCW
jgi:hypothetical protein